MMIKRPIQTLATLTDDQFDRYVERCVSHLQTYGDPRGFDVSAVMFDEENIASHAADIIMANAYAKTTRTGK
jgi:hypothetical protein